MTTFSTLAPAKGSKKPRKRVGRGTGGGSGFTCGRGTKGQKARKSGGVRNTFEGGQTPLIKRMPKLKGFRNINRVEFQVVNVSDLAQFEGKTITSADLAMAKLVSPSGQPVKVLGNGEITVSVTISGMKVSAPAQAKIEKAGGKVEA